MLDVGQVVELGSFKMRVKQLLGGHENLTYKVTDFDVDTPYILRVIEKPDHARFSEDMTPEREEMLKKFYDENEILKEKYPQYCPEAGFEILTSAFQGQVIFEAKILKDYRHKGLSNLLYYTQDEKSYYLILEYIYGDNLQEIIDRREEIPEEKILKWIRQIAEVLKFLHTQEEEKILYNNLNPLNIIIDRDGDARLVDLQRIKIYDPERGRTEEWQDVLYLDSPPPYCPLEGYFNPQAELYALGASFYHLLTGQNVPNAKDRTKNDPLHSIRELKEGYSKKLSTIISLCLEMNPSTRFSSADALLQALESPDFPRIRVEDKDGEIRALRLGKKKKSFEHVMEIRLRKSLPEDPTLLRVNNFNYRWNMKPEAEEPKIELKNIRQEREFTGAQLVITATDIAQGLYEGVVEIDTNWGDAELPIKIDVPAELPKAPIFIGASLVAAIILIVLFCRIFPAKPYDRIAKKWNTDNWDFLKYASSSYVAPRSDIAESSKWEIYSTVPEISVTPSQGRLDISGTLTGSGFVRTGWISNFFHPIGNISVFVTQEDLDLAAGPDRSGLMLLSSNGNAVAVEYVKKGTARFRIASRIEDKWQFVDGQSPGGGEKIKGLKIAYNKVDDAAEVFANDKNIGKVPIALDDIGIFFYITLTKSGDRVNVCFSNLSISSGTSVSRVPPYYQIAKGEYPIMEGPDKDAKRKSKTLADEKVIVQEERDDWCRIKTIQEGEYEGWVKSSELRDLHPNEVKLDS